MNRRDFLKRMIAAGAVAAAPKFIFDMGKNLYKQNDEIVIPDIWEARYSMYGELFIPPSHSGVILVNVE